MSANVSEPFVFRPLEQEACSLQPPNDALMTGEQCKYGHSFQDTVAM